MVSISAADGLSQQKSIQKKTRNTAKIFGLGDAEITGSCLPTCRQVIRCYMYMQEHQTSKHQCKTKYEMAKTVLEKIIPFYCKANIPLISERKACQKIISRQ